MTNTKLSHLTQASKILDGYLTGIYDTCEVLPLDKWTTEDLVRVAAMIDVEIQERDFKREFPSAFAVIVDDEY